VAKHVRLDDAGQLPVGLALERGLQELVLEAPGRVVGDAEVAHELHGGDGVLLLGEQIEGQKPGGQWQLAGGEHGAGGQRGLMAAVLALEQGVDQTHQVGELAVHHLQGLLAGGRLAGQRLEQVEAVAIGPRRPIYGETYRKILVNQASTGGATGTRSR
jgi:hypothetical protein